MGTLVDRGISRRRFAKRLAVTAAGVSLTGALPILSFPRPAIAAGLTPVNFSLSWVPEGGTNFAFAAQQFWEKRGLSVPVNRGYGSVATAQAVATGKVDIAFCAFGSALLSAMKGLDLRMLGIAGYNSTMGVAVRADGPIKTPKDLAGKNIGMVPTSGEVPYFSTYLRMVGVDEASITKTALDDKVLEQTLISDKVDAITMFGSSSIPVFVAQKVPVKSLLYSDANLPFYLMAFVTRPDFLQKNETLCASFMQGVLEGLKFSLLNPDETIKLHLKGAPELAATDTGEEYARLGMGIMQVTMLADEAMKHSLGYGDMASIEKQVATIKQYVASPEDRAIKADEVYTNKYIGNVTLTDAEWDQVRKNNEKIAAIMGKA